MPGSGKTTLARQWVKEMIELNPKENFDVLSFQFEMLGIDEISKDISSKLNKNIKEIYSANGKLSDADLNKAGAALDAMKSYPISIVDNAGTVSDIKDTVLFYVNKHKLSELEKGLIVTIDHSLLIKPNEGEDEQTTIVKLMHTLVALKKYLHSIGVKCIFIVLSQLNRNIESPDRVTNPRLHYPNKNDIFGSSSIYYSSDYVVIIHRPALIDGIGEQYGPSGLPVFNPKTIKNPRQPMIYLHVIKERFGSPTIITMIDELSKARVAEYNP